MLKNLNNDLEKKIQFLVGDTEVLVSMSAYNAVAPFDNETVNVLNTWSKKILAQRDAKGYPDIITFAFWIRKASVLELQKKYVDDKMRFGRGIAFHVAPSNVPVNYAYSLATGMMMGNANIVKIPSKDFPQVTILNDALKETLLEHPDYEKNICLVRYGHEQEVNDVFAAICDVRIIWGGDQTIAQIRRSGMQPRSVEVAFADRFSLAVIDADAYLAEEDKKRVAESFYNDTYLTDQNACTSPRVVVWMGNKKEEAKEIFWKQMEDMVEEKYVFQPIQGVNKLTSMFLLAAAHKDVTKETGNNNALVRVRVNELTKDVIKYKDNSGYFIEYDAKDICELRNLCNDKRCQTITYLGEKEMIKPLLLSGIKGVDRVVSMGKSMDFDYIWDGYNLVEYLTRIIAY